MLRRGGLRLCSRVLGLRRSYELGRRGSRKRKIWTMLLSRCVVASDDEIHIFDDDTHLHLVSSRFVLYFCKLRIPPPANAYMYDWNTSLLATN